MVAFENYIPIILIAIPCIIGAFRWRSMSIPAKVMIYLLGIGAIAEAAQLYSAIKIRSNLEVRYIYNLIEFSVYGLYFDRLIGLKVKNLLFIAISILSLVAFTANIMYFQPFHGNNSNFMLFEGLFTTGLCLWALAKMFMDSSQIHITNDVDFWICMITLFFWCSTYFSWAAHEVAHSQHLESSEFIVNIIYAMNVLTYISMCFVFLLTRKNIGSND